MKFALVLCAAVAALLPLRTSAGDDLLSRMAQLNPNLHSYTAAMSAHVALTSFPFLSTDITATYYHKDPDLDKLEITSGLPAIAGQFGKLYPRIEPPSRWNEVFVVTKTADDGTHTTFRLVPRKTGNVGQIDAVVDDRAATVTSMRWSYANGASASMENTYGTVQGNVVIVSQSGEVNEPSYRGTIASHLTDYKINPPLPDSIFAQGAQ